MQEADSFTQQGWQELLRYILLGTDQVSLPEQWSVYTDTYQSSDEEAPALLLALIGKTHLLDKGALPLARWQGALPEAPPPSSGKPCSWRSVQHLQLILSGHHLRALPEFIKLLKEHQKRLPAESIPALLNQCLEEPAIWQLLQPLLGASEMWLIRQHPHWSSLLPNTAAFDRWPEAQGKAQFEILRSYRKTEPEAARDSLSDHWLNLDHREQARVLPALEEGLSSADEAFLEHCLQASRKGIRQAAADLLGQLPESTYVQAVFDLLQTVLQLDQGKVSFELGDDLPEQARNFGVYPTGSKIPGGLQVNTLQQLLARVPFSRWTQLWNIKPFELVQAFANAAHGLLLLKALNESLLRFPEQEGQQALVRWWLLSGQENGWNTKPGKALLELSTAEFFNESLTKWLEQFGPLVPADTLVAHWLSTSTHSWSNSLSKIVVLGFQDVIQGRRTADWHLWHYRQLFEAAGYCSDPKLLEHFRSGWSFRSNSFGRWHTDLEKMLQSLHFRQEMQTAIQQG